MVKIEKLLQQLSSASSFPAKSLQGYKEYYHILVRKTRKLTGVFFGEGGCVRLFECEANFIREAAYFSFCIYQDYCVQYKDSEDFEILKTIQAAYDRAMKQQTLANFLDWQRRYNFWLRYFADRKQIHPTR